MRVRVTGATGYVGRAVAIALARAGHEVTALTRDPGSDRARTLGDVGVRPLCGRLADRGALSEVLAGADAVVHTAFDPADPDGTNRSLFRALADAGSRQHLVYTSGCSAYGKHEHTLLTPQTPVDNGNARARLEAELRGARLPHTVLRPGMVHGGDARSSIVGDWFSEARSTGPVHRGRRDKVWSWIHVEDLARAYAAVLCAPQDHEGRTYLLADSHPAAPLVVVEAAARAAGSRGLCGAIL
ncbi:NmrA family NAD(P)-binding protein [Streptacidiphilus sp. PB12-B1b]|uniref:NAD-dependent epimerase/dehydratase family protein n=1 Tax=Streptacidiphilus sp. PB12-B1b TaxID=2705012 RepID=UPI0015FE6E97|nr:NAD(P)H-binding protein [Streptacidiphilus sp. PB12-B1b]QMU77216.1 NmrA family NAD(P)-binding protein [Streptacidiphilus sp. PB12-B1b]